MKTFCTLFVHDDEQMSNIQKFSLIHSADHKIPDSKAIKSESVSVLKSETPNNKIEVIASTAIDAHIVTDESANVATEISRNSLFKRFASSECHLDS